MSHAADSDLDDAVEAFQRVRRRLFGIAYRMLGSVSEAEDIVQEAWLRWQSTDRTLVRSPEAFLMTTTTRLAITAATTARVRHEVYVGPWLPEPVSTTDDPALGAESAETLAVAVLLMLERLTPTERAVYVLREAFEYPFAQIAEVLETSESNARQIGRRARLHLAEERHEPVSDSEHDRLLEALLAAMRLGDLESLEAVLAEDVVSISDGGGVVSASRRPVVGRDHVGRFLAGVVRKARAGFRIDVVKVNSRSSALISYDDEPAVVISIDGSAAGIEGIYVVANPTKLQGLGVAR
ncbi:RNA polymerase sigma-70 factor [Conyzicola nivalis]|uniref:RNA polymerase sigma24 factor n=1 Tax=Conyzicola nivalis TaxID=1477021 RepID=A0A916SCD4_9MICO|nr:RNA polymerase sigma-70 factor [Conyzicola nivalis]GGA93543.1 RNA polymerase sigma24 factor [Conyzicola nivalis]